ncbi:hypothetical protein ACFL08_05840 [Patescibacteria group bacterium]
MIDWWMANYKAFMPWVPFVIFSAVFSILIPGGFLSGFLNKDEREEIDKLTLK